MQLFFDGFKIKKQLCNLIIFYVTYKMNAYDYTYCLPTL